jgi:2-C-methyl-D-erythritol 4-phosphate cytidylyltransferase
MRAYESANGLEKATDDCSLVEAAGYQIAIVEGSPENIKITVRHDLVVASRLLEDRE